MKSNCPLLLLFLLFGIAAAAERREKRQANYGNYNPAPAQNYQQAPAASYRQPQQQLFPPPPQQYAPQQQQQQQQQYGGVQQRPAPRPLARPAAAPGEEEKDEGPHPLAQLLEKSKFECNGKNDGYYADGDVGCQAFHYCVSGHKHSMMCPAGTVFHQVHLNCVPADQDICAKSDKFYFVNDYLNKPLEQRGPNNTIQYHQRYYPEGYSVGDPFIPPQEAHKAHGSQQQNYQQAYGQPQAPAPFTPQQAGYGPPAQQYANRPYQPVAQQPAPAYQQQQQQPVRQYQPVQTYQQQPANAAQRRPGYYQQQQPQQQQDYAQQQQQQQQALQAHRIAEAAVRAQHYQATRQQLVSLQQPQQVAQQQPQQAQYAYGAAPSRSRLSSQY